MSIEVKAWNGENIAIDKVDDLYMGRSVQQISGKDYMNAILAATKENEAKGLKPFEGINLPEVASKDGKDSVRRNALFVNDCRDNNKELFDSFIKAKMRDPESLSNAVELMHQVRTSGNPRDRETAKNLLSDYDEVLGAASEKKISKVSVDTAVKLGMASGTGFALVNLAYVENPKKGLVSKSLIDSPEIESFRKTADSGGRRFLDSNIEYSKEVYENVDKSKAIPASEKIASLRKRLGKEGEEASPVAPLKAQKVDKNIDFTQLRYMGTEK